MNGNTALHIAAEYNQGEAMKLILRADTSLVFLKNHRDKTALDISTENKFHLCIELVRLFSDTWVCIMPFETYDLLR